MDAKRIRRCKVCGAAYEGCYSCDKAKSWRAHTDTADHYYILTVLMEYKGGHDAKRAYRALRKRGVDFQDTERYIPSVRALLDEIYAIHKGRNVSARKTVLASTPAEASVEAEAEPPAASRTEEV